MSAPRKRPRQQRSRETVEWILEAAEQLFVRDGYLGVTTNRVAERAGVSIGSLYQYFPNKDALLLELADRHATAMVTALRETIRAAGARHGEVEGVVRDVVGTVAEWHAKEPDLHRLFVAQAERTPALLARVREVEHEVAAVLAEELGRVRERPVDVLDVLLVVQGVDAQVHGTLLDPPSGHTAQEVTDRIVDQWCRVLAEVA
ncbi:TetR/AcrR family transcriptional regulator [Spiractinospora alimapuensis]|uniref:TetR/AcrR family transcriptional regulator n=1 Tax=Spiractinospora alimapuensis TaxID=2820884 RepID=UPI001F3F76CF|nr:TetR/AcrR family transcriptional regulator [Spiractinospora alimapuensis]